MVFVVGVAMASACGGFDARECRPFDRENDDVLPPWPIEQDSAPAADGPTITAADLEYVERDDCVTAIDLTLTLTDPQDDVDVDSVRASITIFNGLLGEAYRPSNELDITRDGATFFIPMCDRNYQGRGGRFVHVNDAAGHGSQAFCAHTFARSDDVTPGEGEPGP